MYKKATELKPEFGPAYYQWGILLMNSNNCKKAIVKFQKATEYEHAFKLDSYGMWGACLENMGKYQEAINEYQTIIRMAPNSIQANRSKNSINRVKGKLQGRHRKI